VCLLAVCATTACDAKYPTGPTGPAPVAALSIQYTTPSTDPRVGATFSYAALALDTDAAYRDVTSSTVWFSADSTVVRSVSGTSSTLLAVNSGTTEVFASYEGLTAAIPVVVQADPLPYPHLDFAGNPPLPTVFIHRSPNPTDKRLVTPTSWTSSDPAVLSVDSTGAVHEGAVGRARITAWFGELSLSYNMSVFPRRQ
jgi:uncharacterized protein YjdB